ncbi:unnamed protein product [Cuscuta europaea]|uniref:Uncharacterized protein n=1 Tax=Cuscuta europaea TaxID=41803 RepID=A0A9P0Z862_CUSEU|nr:unnamed protein product [Cuscuta europaea]
MYLFSGLFQTAAELSLFLPSPVWPLACASLQLTTTSAAALRIPVVPCHLSFQINSFLLFHILHRMEINLQRAFSFDTPSCCQIHVLTEYDGCPHQPATKLLEPERKSDPHGPMFHPPPQALHPSCTCTSFFLRLSTVG